MHLKRQKLTTKLPIPRKGTKFVVRALSNYHNAVPALIAVRDMLGLAKNAKEVQHMINQKLIKINGRTIKNPRESIHLFNLLEANKNYVLTILPTGKFTLVESKSSDSRICKVIGKKIIKNNKVQFNLHDGTNIISNEKISIGDSLYIDLSNKIKKHTALEKGSEIIIISGKYIGLKGKIQSRDGKKITIILEDRNSPTNLNQEQVFAL